MTHADAFLQDILAHPDDDAPRLIFADWLEEQGDANSAARAEFIRIQCALAGRQVPKQRRGNLERRQWDILGEWEREWARRLHPLVLNWEFHRGFIDNVTMRIDKFHTQADQLFRRAPVQHLTLQQRNGPFSARDMAVLAENEHLRCLCSLNFSFLGLESRDLRSLIVSKHLNHLTSLNLSNNRIGDSGIRALATSPLLERLQHLNLRNNDIGANGLRALVRALEAFAESPEGLRLEWLELYYPGLSAAGQRVIAESPLLRRLVFD